VVTVWNNTRVILFPLRVHVGLLIHFVCFKGVCCGGIKGTYSSDTGCKCEKWFFQVFVFLDFMIIIYFALICYWFFFVFSFFLFRFLNLFIRFSMLLGFFAGFCFFRFLNLFVRFNMWLFICRFLSF